MVRYARRSCRHSTCQLEEGECQAVAQKIFLRPGKSSVQTNTMKGKLKTDRTFRKILCMSWSVVRENLDQWGNEKKDNLLQRLWITSRYGELRKNMIWSCWAEVTKRINRKIKDRNKKEAWLEDYFVFVNVEFEMLMGVQRFSTFNIHSHYSLYMCSTCIYWTVDGFKVYMWPDWCGSVGEYCPRHQWVTSSILVEAHT